MQPRKISESRLTMSRLMVPLDTNPYGSIHGGVIMRAIDEAAAVTAARHARMNVVTASIDRLFFIEPVRVGELVFFRASVNSVGRASMEVGVRVEAENLITGNRRHVASAYLTFVALGADGKPSPVPGLVPENDVERRRMAEAARRKERRLAELREEGV